MFLTKRKEGWFVSFALRSRKTKPISHLFENNDIVKCLLHTKEILSSIFIPLSNCRKVPLSSANCRVLLEIQTKGFFRGLYGFCTHKKNCVLFAYFYALFFFFQTLFFLFSTHLFFSFSSLLLKHICLRWIFAPLQLFLPLMGVTTPKLPPFPNTFLSSA